MDEKHKLTGILVLFNDADIINMLPVEENSNFWKSYFEYAKTKKEPNFDDYVSSKLIWGLIKPHIDYDRERYVKKLYDNAYANYTRWAAAKGIKKENILTKEEWAAAGYPNFSEITPNGIHMESKCIPNGNERNPNTSTITNTITNPITSTDINSATKTEINTSTDSISNTLTTITPPAVMECEEEIPVISSNSYTDNQFQEFWESYPACRRQYPELAKTAFFKIDANKVPFNELMAALSCWCRSEIWRNQERYIPNVYKWLNEEYYMTPPPLSETEAFKRNLREWAEDCKMPETVGTLNQEINYLNEKRSKTYEL